MQDLASECSQIFRGDTSGPTQREGVTTSRTQHTARCKRPGVRTQTLVPSTF